MTDDEKELLEAAAKGASDSALEPIKQPLMNLAGPFTEQLGHILALPFKWWRFKASFAIMEKAKRFLDERGVKPQHVPMKLLAPILENGSLEDDESMVDRWASLLASAADPNYKQTILPSFPDVLRQLSAREVAILEKLYAPFILTESNRKNEWKYWFIPIEGSDFGMSVNEFGIVRDNLRRLELLFWHPNTLPRHHIPKEFSLTCFGFAFVSACHPQGQPVIDAASH